MRERKILFSIEIFDEENGTLLEKNNEYVSQEYYGTKIKNDVYSDAFRYISLTVGKISENFVFNRAVIEEESVNSSNKIYIKIYVVYNGAASIFRDSFYADEFKEGR